MTRSRRYTEEIGQRGQADSTDPALEQTSSERGRAQRRLGQPPSLDPEQLPFEEAVVETRVVCDEEVVARKCEEARHDARDRRCGLELSFAQPGQPRDRFGERNARIYEGLEDVDRLERPDADRAQLANPAPIRREP